MKFLVWAIPIVWGLLAIVLATLWWDKILAFFAPLVP